MNNSELKDLENDMLEELTQYEWALSDLELERQHNFGMFSDIKIKKLKNTVNYFENRYGDIDGFYRELDELRDRN